MEDDIWKGFSPEDFKVESFSSSRGLRTPDNMIRVTYLPTQDFVVTRVYETRQKAFVKVIPKLIAMIKRNSLDFIKEG